MGKGAITFSDDGDEITCDIAFDPPLDVENDRATPAQFKLLEIWRKIAKLAQEESRDDKVGV